MDQERYEYNPQFLMLFLCGGLFALCTAGLVHIARTNDEGLVINGLIELSVSGATQFHWSLATLSFGFVLIALFAFVHRLKHGKQYLIISDDALSIPKGVFTSEKRIKFSSIQSIETQTVSGTTFYTFRTDEANKDFSITNRTFKNKQEFETAINSILSKLNFL